MRFVNLVFIVLAPFFCWSQDLHLKGEVFYVREDIIDIENKEIKIIKDTVPLNKYSIYLYRFAKYSSRKRKVYKGKSTDFSFTISDRKKRRYNYIEFFSKEKNVNYIFDIDSIPDGELEIVCGLRSMFSAKPVIYLYPESKKEINIQLTFTGELLNTYPQYNDGWNIIAEPNGTLYNLNDGRTYNYLFWDGLNGFDNDHYSYSCGFYVGKGEYIEFLQTKLSHIGLSNSETNDFITYWLPELNKHENCFIHFRINDNIDNTAFIHTEPDFDTKIRVYMEFKGLERMVVSKLPEQLLPQIERKGSVLVEWGGANIEYDFLNDY